ncbi:MAG TPA: SDR family oxidoreductase [Candidatus Thermoplasmatota archaeon]|nr:SDR family oxidoreductase [Candidatus Thermoplasmatota archaeon]
MKVVVTGGAGFIGSHIAESYVNEGAEVHIIDDLATGHRRNVPAGATFHEGSILDSNLLSKVFAGASFVFHQAALGSVPRSISDPLRSNEVNVSGTLGVLLAARDAQVRKVVFAASSSAYGDTPTLPKHEAMPVNPQSPYAVTKVAGEHYCRAFSNIYGLPTTALRYFNVYGPRQDPNGAYAAVIPRFIAAAFKGNPLLIYGDGSQTRDFTYVADVVRANKLAAEEKRTDGLVMNIGAAGRTSIRELAGLVIRLSRSQSRIELAPSRPGDIRDSLADLTLAERAMGYRPEYPITQGLKLTVEHFISSAIDEQERV